MIQFGSGVTGFEMKNQQSTHLGSGYQVRNPRSTAGVVGCERVCRVEQVARSSGQSYQKQIGVLV